jgi:hypothetical protein
MVDKFSTIPLLENSNKHNAEVVAPVQLGSSYNAVKCIVDSKASDSKPHIQSHLQFLNPAGKYIGPNLIPGLSTNFNSILQVSLIEANIFFKSVFLIF